MFRHTAYYEKDILQKSSYNQKYYPLPFFVFWLNAHSL